MEKIHTKEWTVDKNVYNFESCPQIVEAAHFIKNNEVVAFPTETVYGLGANAYSDEAVGKIFQAKGRPSDNPLIVHIANIEQLKLLVTDVSETAQKLMKQFWPGPLTLVMESKGEVSRIVTAGLTTVAVRMPEHPVALALINEASIPIAAPSANKSGKPSPTKAVHVKEDLYGKIAGILDGGTTGIGLESTVVDVTSEVPMILRPGGITMEQLEAVVGEVSVDPAITEEGQAPKSPGVKYKHYAPKATLTIVEGEPVNLQRIVDHHKWLGKKVGVLCCEENKSHYNSDVVISCGSITNLTSIAYHLYDCLRQFDQYDLDAIVGESFPEIGVGKAIMNRLTKAAAGKVIRCE